MNDNGVQKYVEKGKKMSAERARYIKEEVKKWKFETRSGRQLKITRARSLSRFF